MTWTEVRIKIKPSSPGSEIMMALLSEIGYESFEETEEGLKAYINSANFSTGNLLDIIKGIAENFDISFEYSEIPNQNWNEVWESAYEPVTIRNDIYIRAPFHKEKPEFRYQLLIEPKMSFGTAHHETTYLMMELMLDEQLGGKRLLDMGCGTGILAILGEMLGAGNIVAIDNDENAYENALENVRKNKCKNILVLHGDSGLINDQYDVILANINKNILLDDMDIYADHLSPSGLIFLSGFYESDLEDIKRQAGGLGLEYDRSMVKNNWMAARFTKTK
ncbi:MAG: 50S ribosomal protein L11 methyltransferase [Bacteroidales bacterium]